MRTPYAVTVPYYANPLYLRLTLDSVVAQTDADWWCAVVDDSPDDSARAVVEAVGDPRVRLERNGRTLGVAGNFERCFEVAEAGGAELAVVLHADDLLEPGYVAAVRAAHAAHPDAACVTPRVTVIDHEGRPHLPLPDRVKAALWPRHDTVLGGDRGLQRLLRGQFFYCPAVSYRLALVPRPAWDERWRQVMDLMLYGRVLLQGGSIELLDERLFRYRRHEASETQLNSATLSRTVEEHAACRELAAGAAALGWRRARWAGVLRWTVRLQCLVQAARALVGRRWRVAGRAVVLAVTP
ncbi:MAG: glycosyltransferase [Acidimicrobiales bacterium]